MNRRLGLLAGVFLLALIPRALVLCDLRADLPTYEAPEGGDSIFYDRVASGEVGHRRAYFHSPLYRWFVTGVYSVFGRNLTAVRVIQHLLGVLTAGLVFLIVQRLTGRPGAAALAGGLWALYGPGIFYESQLLVAGILPVLMAAAALATLWWVGEPGRPKALLLGLLFGLAALARANLLVGVPIVAGWMLLEKTPWRYRWQQPALLGAGVLLMLLPVTVRNYMVEGDFVAVTANGGLNLYIGNNPNARGTYNLPEGLWFEPGDPRDDFMGIRAASRAAGRPLSSSEISGFWAKKALGFVADYPGRTVLLALSKLRLLASDHEIPQLYNYYVYAEIAPLLGLLPTSGFILAPALLGLFLVFFRTRKEFPAGGRLLAWLAVGYGLSFVPFFVIGRFRAPWMVWLAPFAAVALAAGFTALWGSQGRRAAWLGAGLAVAVLVCFWPPAWPANPSSQYLMFGNARLAQGRPAPAARWFERAVSADPRNARAHENLGVALAELGRLSVARRSLEKAAGLWPDSGRIHNNLGLVLRRMESMEQAERAFRRAIAAEPGLAEAYGNLGSLLEELGDTRGALDAYRSALRLAGQSVPWAARLRRRVLDLQINESSAPPR